MDPVKIVEDSDTAIETISCSGILYYVRVSVVVIQSIGEREREREYVPVPQKDDNTVIHC